MVPHRLLQLVGISFIAILGLLLILQQRQIADTRTSLHHAAVETIYLDALVLELIESSSPGSAATAHRDQAAASLHATKLPQPIHNNIQNLPGVAQQKSSAPMKSSSRRAILFTMDSITSCEPLTYFHLIH